MVVCYSNLNGQIHANSPMWPSHTHTHTHTHTQSNLNGQIHANSQCDLHTHTHTHTFTTLRHTYAHIQHCCVHMRIQIHLKTYACMYTSTHTHVQSHERFLLPGRKHVFGGSVFFFLVFADPLLSLHPCRKPGWKLLNKDSFCPHSCVFMT